MAFGWIDRDVLRARILARFGHDVLHMYRVESYFVFDVTLRNDEHVIARFERNQINPTIARNMRETATIMQYLRSQAMMDFVPQIIEVEDGEDVGLPYTLMSKVPGQWILDTYRDWRKVDIAVRQARLVHATRSIGAAYIKLFNIPIPDGFADIFDENHQHHHDTPMPPGFDIVLTYDHNTEVTPEILRARQLRQETATYVAHIFWHVMHDSKRAMDPRAPREALRILHRLKALVPFVIPTVDQFMTNDGMLGVRKFHHYDPSIYNIILDPHTGDVTGIVDWEKSTACPAVLSAAYPEWIRYDGEITPMNEWCCLNIQYRGETFDYSDRREVYRTAVAEISPFYAEAMRAGQPLLHVVDWAKKLRAASLDIMDERFALVNRWIEGRATELGVTLPTVFLTKQDWISAL